MGDDDENQANGEADDAVEALFGCLVHSWVVFLDGWKFELKSELEGAHEDENYGE